MVPRWRKSGFRVPVTPGEPRTTTEHWRTGAPWTRFSVPFLRFSLSRPPRTRLHTSCRSFAGYPPVLRLFLQHGATGSRGRRATLDCRKVFRWLSHLLNGFSRDDRDRTGRETTTGATATHTRKKSRGRETVSWFCAGWDGFNFVETR